VFGCPPLLSSSEVGESSRGGGFEGVGGSPGVAIDVSFYFQTLGVSHKGECEGLFGLNYDARGLGSSRGKARGP
jgi:hypothetical protein